DVGADDEGRAAEPRPELEQQYGSDWERAPDERRQDGAEQQERAERSHERADLAAREALLRADDDDGEHQAGAHEVREAEEQRARPQERPSPEESEALPDARA